MHVTKPFAATGRGRRLVQLANSPLKAQEFGRRKKLQEKIMSGELPNLSEPSLNEYFGPYCNGIRGKVQGEENNNHATKKHTASQKQTEENFSLNSQTQVQGMIDHQNHSGGLIRTGSKSKFTGIKGNANTLDSRRQMASADNISKISSYRTEETGSSLENDDSGTSSWDDWERSVVIEGKVDDEDIDEFALVEDNDDINDVIVQQYISALHDEQKQKNGTVGRKDMKITPTKVQQISKLKSTTNADSAKHPPGTVPNPPKGLDRWGGSELNDVKEPTGWGEIDEGSTNWYNDGVAIWDSTCANTKVGNETKATANGKSSEVQQFSTFQSKQPTKTFSSGKVGEIKTQTVAKTGTSPLTPNCKALQQGGPKGFGKTPEWGRSSRTFNKSSGTTSLQRTEKHLETKQNNGQKTTKLSSSKFQVPWGDSVRQDVFEPSGWGETDSSSKNWYDDGSSLWDTPVLKNTVTSGQWK